MLPNEFHTRRLIARLPVEGDAELIFQAYARKPEVTTFVLWPPHRSVEVTQSFISQCIALAAESGRRPYVLALRQSPALPIGMLDARPAGHRLELGYVLAPQCWGNGYMPEAVAGLAAIALASEEIFRVQAFCAVANVPSQRTLEKAGFSREGRLERYSVHPNYRPEPIDCYMYAKCR